MYHKMYHYTGEYMIVALIVLGKHEMFPSPEQVQFMKKDTLQF